MINCCAKIFVDTGSGFSPEADQVTPLGGGEITIEMALRKFGPVHEIRLIPAEDFCVTDIRCIEIERADGTHYILSGYRSNALIQEDHRLWFTSKDPCITLPLFNRVIGKIRISMEHVSLGDRALDQALKQDAASRDTYWRAAMKETRTQVIKLSGELTRVNNSVARLQGEINSLKERSTLRDLFSGNTLHTAKRRVSALIRWIGTDPREMPKKIAGSAFLLNRSYRVIARSNLFDSTFYRKQFKKSEKPARDPIHHYLTKGARNGLTPCALFDSEYYLDQYPDVARTAVNPLAHYLLCGAAEGRNPNRLFDSAYYLERYPDVVQAGINPLVHYIQSGATEGRDPSRNFDTTYYFEQNPEVKASGQNPLAHYLETGSREGRDANRKLAALTYRPFISIVCPVYDIDERLLHKCIRSVCHQVYPRWELNLVDDASSRSHIKPILEAYARKDPRIHVKLLDKNRGTANASQIGAEMASGAYLAFLDHDDELVADALFEVVSTLNRVDAEILYSDEGVIDEIGRSLSWICKPDFSPDLLLSFNYMTHLLVVKKELFYEVGGFDDAFEGAQDYDLVLKLSEASSRIAHIHKVLYNWRQIRTSTSVNPEAKPYADESGQKAVAAALERRDIDAEVHKGKRAFYYHVKRHITASPPVSIIIPFRDQPRHLERCVHAIREKTTYGNFEIVGINNRSENTETLDLMSDLAKSQGDIKFFDYPNEFNYSKIVNHSVGLCGGEHIVFMNNDIEVLNPDWLESLLEHSQRPSIGAVGAKLYYPDGSIQHAGIILGISGFAGHGHRNFPGDSPGYYNRLKCIQNVSAVTGALMMVKRRHYEAVGGFDQEHLAIALNDVDFCLRLQSIGLRNVFTPFCEAVHYESASRGYEVSPEKQARFDREIRYFQRRWEDALNNGDSYYNRHLTLNREDFSLNSEQRQRFESINRFKAAD
jgi:GT2 family glycosyltransferase